MAELEEEYSPEFSEMDIVMAQQFVGMLDRHQVCDKMVRERGQFIIEVDNYPLTINRNFCDVMRRMIFTARHQYFIDTGHPDIPIDILVSRMESRR
jgi:hypothetical protein